MIRRTFPLFLTLILSCAAPPPAFRATPGDFQPLDAGLEWTYDADGRTQVRKVVGRERVGRFDCAVVESRTGDDIERHWMRWDRDGLKLYRVSEGRGAVDFDDPPLLIPKLTGPGATWSFEERHGPVTLVVEGRHEGEDAIPWGERKLACARIRLVKRVAGKVVVDQVSWYARDIGLVRMTVTASSGEGQKRATLELRRANFLPE